MQANAQESSYEVGHNVARHARAYAHARAYTYVRAFAIRCTFARRQLDECSCSAVSYRSIIC